MINIKIPKEIMTYEAKLIGPFTTRQTVCVACIALVDIILYNIIGSFVSSDLAIFICILGAAPFALCGWYKPYGMHFEQYFKTVLINMFLAPTKRVYKTENTFTPIYDKLVQREKNRRNRIASSKSKKKSSSSRKSVSKSSANRKSVPSAKASSQSSKVKRK